MSRPTSPKSFIKRLFSSKIFLFFIGLALIWLGVSLGQESYRKYQLTKEINALKSEIEKIESNNEQLASLIEFFQQESYLEKEARLKLNLKQPGEKVVIVPQAEQEIVEETENQETAKQSLSKEPAEKRKESNLWQWWEYFFGG